MVAVKALACQLPTNTGAPLARWHCPDLARAAVEQGIVASLSGTHDLAVAVRRPREHVISADEKTSIQARIRKHDTTPPPAPGQPMRVEHEYTRGGALAHLAAWDVHRAKVFGRCEDSSGIEPFNRLVDQLMTTEPYASARTVYWVVDNGSSHRGQASITRLESGWPTLRLIHLPIHASWLNQVEIYFSVVKRKVITPNDSTDLDQLAARLLAFQDHYQQIAEPFEWKFTTADLHDLLARITTPDAAPLAA
ncbi:MAG: transposase [Acidimicrobiales bacterium]